MKTLYKFTMNKFNCNYLHILDLPDEIFFSIFDKLNMIDVFYSLVGVNRRFHRLALDSLYIRDLNMTSMTTINSLYDQTSIDTQLLSKICEQILPRISDQVQRVTVEEFSMKRVLLAANYPRLYSLSLMNFQKDILYQCLTGIVLNFIY